MIQPIIFWGAWLSAPHHILRSLTGRSQLPIHELLKSKVNTPYARIRPLPKSSGSVHFSAWRLAHAVKKADCLRWTGVQTPLLGASGFLLENGDLFDWNASELRLNQGKASFYADFTSSSLSGRIAQGMAVLFLEDMGYAYVGRFETEWKQRAATQNRGRPTGMGTAPDFIAENVNKDWVLAEAKGGFSSPGRKPRIKGALEEGLHQLEGWDKYIYPQPIKSFVIGTFLRETGDADDETSVIAFVDPEPETPDNPVEFPRDAVRRANYASWLQIMGLDGAAARLRGDHNKSRKYELPCLSLNGRHYAIRIASFTHAHPEMFSREFMHKFRDLPFRPFWWSKHGFDIEIIGLDLEVLKALGSATESSSTLELMSLKPLEQRDTPVDLDGIVFSGSIFSDGSLLGALTICGGDLPFNDFEWITLTL